MKKYSLNGDVIAEGYFVNAPYIKRGEYKETEIDKQKKAVDFLITSCSDRTAISFNKPVELKCNRSISRVNCGGHVYYVTDRALEHLKKQYTWACDF